MTSTYLCDQFVDSFKFFPFGKTSFRWLLEGLTRAQASMRRNGASFCLAAVLLFTAIAGALGTCGPFFATNRVEDVTYLSVISSASECAYLCSDDQVCKADDPEYEGQAVQVQGPVHGLTASFFRLGENFTAENATIPDVTGQLPNLVAYVDNVDLGSPDIVDADTPGATVFPYGYTEEFVTLIEGFLHIEFPGDYSFLLVSDDSARLRINSELVISNDGNDFGPQYSDNVTRALTPGCHSLAVRYFQNNGSAAVTLLWTDPETEEWVPVPRSTLFSSACACRAAHNMDVPEPEPPVLECKAYEAIPTQQYCNHITNANELWVEVQTVAGLGTLYCAGTTFSADVVGSTDLGNGTVIANVTLTAEDTSSNTTSVCSTEVRFDYCPPVVIPKNSSAIFAGSLMKVSNSSKFKCGATLGDPNELIEDKFNPNVRPIVHMDASVELDIDRLVFTAQWNSNVTVDPEMLWPGGYNWTGLVGFVANESVVGYAQPAVYSSADSGSAYVMACDPVLNCHAVYNEGILAEADEMCVAGVDAVDTDALVVGSYDPNNWSEKLTYELVDLPSSDLFMTGPNAVGINATSIYGTSATCNATVIVTPCDPYVSCGDVQLPAVGNSTVGCSATLDPRTLQKTGNVTVWDGNMAGPPTVAVTGGDNLVYTFSLGGGPAGNYSLTATNGFGNSTTCTGEVFVEDTTGECSAQPFLPPTVTCLSSREVGTLSLCAYAADGSVEVPYDVVLANVSDPTANLSTTTAVSRDPTADGLYAGAITLVAENSAGEDSCTVDVLFAGCAPKLTCSKVTVQGVTNVFGGCAYPVDNATLVEAIVGPSASTNVTYELVGVPEVLPAGKTINVTVEATSEGGGSATCTVPVTVSACPSTLTCGTIFLNATKGCAAHLTASAARASGNITYFNGTAEVSPSKLKISGDNNATYAWTNNGGESVGKYNATATNSKGKKASCTGDVVVYDTVKPKSSRISCGSVPGIPSNSLFDFVVSPAKASNATFEATYGSSGTKANGCPVTLSILDGSIACALGDKTNCATIVGSPSDSVELTQPVTPGNKIGWQVVAVDDSTGEPLTGPADCKLCVSGGGRKDQTCDTAFQYPK